MTPGDVVIVASHMVGPEVQRFYQETTGLVTAVGMEEDERAPVGPASPRREPSAARTAGPLR